MKTKIAFVILIMCLALLVSACDFWELQEIPKEYWGEWVAYDLHGSGTVNVIFSGDKIIWKRINGDYKENLGIKGMSEITFKRRDNICSNMVYFKYDLRTDVGGNGEYYLFPAQPKISFSGNIVSLDDSSRSTRTAVSDRQAVSGLGGIEVRVLNRDKSGLSSKSRTDNNGRFTVDNIIPGDVYEIETEGQKHQFSPMADGDDMGTITVTKGLNFKASTDGKSMYSWLNGKSPYYSIKIYIKNIGTERATGTTYTITPEVGLRISESYSNNTVNSVTGILGTVEPKETKTIDLGIGCDVFQEDYKWKKIFIELHDPISKKTWNDSISILVYRGETGFKLYSNFVNNSVSLAFIVISPDGKSYGDNTHSSVMYEPNGAYVSMPSLKGEYTIIVIGREGIYSLGMDRDEHKKAAANFLDTGRYKPNQTEAQAAKVTLPIMAYMIKGGIDFYKVRLN